MRLAARAALHFESVKVGVFFGVRGLEVGHAISESQRKTCPKAYCPLNMSMARNRSFLFFFSDGAGRAQKNGDLKSNLGGIMYVPLQLSLKDQRKHICVVLDLR